MNVLLVSSKYMPEYSGSGLRAHNTYRRLVAKAPGLQVRALCGSVTDNTPGAYEYDGFKVFRAACKPFPSLSKAGPLRRLQMALNFRAESAAARRFLPTLPWKPDVTHIFGRDYVSAAVLDYANRERIPAIIELCNDSACPFHYAPFPFSLTTNVKPPERHLFVCISPRLKDMCLANGIPMERIWCRPNPVEESRFRPASDDERASLRRKHSVFPDGGRLVSYVAKFSPGKNHILLVDAISKLPEDFKLFLGGPLAETGAGAESFKALVGRIESEVAARNLQDRVIVRTGFVPDVDDYYRMSDVYAFPSKMEGLGTPMLEAISCATPVVANTIPSVTDIWIRDGRNGFLSSLSAADFADKISQAVKIPRETLLDEAFTLHSIAGSKAIDDRYVQILNSMAAQ